MTPGISVNPPAELGAQTRYRRQPRRRPRNRYRKTSDVWSRLNPRQRKYVEGVISGKTKFAAALETGYSRASAENAGHIIEGPDVRKAFEAICQQAISIELLASRVREGLDAMQTRFFDYKGVITDQRQVIAWDTKRRTINRLFTSKRIAPSSVQIR